MSIQRGSTPVHIFKTSVDLRDAEVIYITYQQNGVTVVEKEKADCEIFEDRIQVELSQDDTLLFSRPTKVGCEHIGEGPTKVKIQIRARFHDGTAIVSNIVLTDVGILLKNGVI